MVHLDTDFSNIEDAERGEQELEHVSRGMLKAKILQALSKQTVEKAELDVTVPNRDEVQAVQKVTAAHNLDLESVQK
ncbi:MAG: hypothetical protein ACYCW6_29160 [Candidatus Xenobia bacterium]